MNFFEQLLTMKAHLIEKLAYWMARGVEEKIEAYRWDLALVNAQIDAELEGDLILN